MIELITAQDWAKSPELRNEVFEFRYQVFINRLRWDVTSHDYLEFDEYDGLLPLYMLARDSSKRLIALWRLLPTTGPYMLRNSFPQLLGGREPPRSDKIWEVSRFAFDPKGFRNGGTFEFAQVTGRMLCGLCEFSLEKGINEVVVVYDTRFSQILRRLSRTPKWIGPPCQIGNCTAVAASYEISQEILFSLRKTVSLNQTLLIQNLQRRKAA